MKTKPTKITIKYLLTEPNHGEEGSYSNYFSSFHSLNSPFYHMPLQITTFHINSFLYINCLSMSLFCLHNQVTFNSIIMNKCSDSVS